MFAKLFAFFRNLFRLPAPAPEVLPAPTVEAAKIAPATSAAAPEPTILITETGHNMPYPKPELGEGLLGYYIRTCPITGGDPNAAGGLIVMQSGLHYSDWPHIADEYANRDAFLTTAERDTYRLAKIRDAAAYNKPFTGPIAVASLTLEDKMFMVSSRDKELPFRALSGTGAEIALAINDAGSSNAAATASFDRASYTGRLRDLEVLRK